MKRIKIMKKCHFIACVEGFLNILIFIDTVETRVKKFGKTYHKENLKEEIIKATIEIIVNEEVESVLMRALATLVIFFCSAIVTVITTRNFRILQFTNFSF